MLVAGRVSDYIAAVGRLSVSLFSAIMLGASFMRLPKAIAKGQSQNDWYFPIGLIKGVMSNNGGQGSTTHFRCSAFADTGLRC